MIPDSSLIHNNDEGIFSFIGHNWHNYTNTVEQLPTEWYRLFDDPTDPRRRLTWRRRFGTIQAKTDVFNFYSSTEDVLRVNNNVNDFLDMVDWGSIRPHLRFHLLPVTLLADTVCAWQIQEMYKGLNEWIPSYTGGGSSCYCGWGFTKTRGIHYKGLSFFDFIWNTFKLHSYFERPYTVATWLSTESTNSVRRTWYLSNLQSDPLFRRKPAILFDPDNGSIFAAGIVGDYEDILDYDNGEILGAPDINVSQVPIRDFLLAKAFPSRTGPMGSCTNSLINWKDVNFDMSLQFMTDQGQWYKPEKYLGRYIWRHSDWKDAPYVYLYKLFDKITGKEN